MQRESYHKDDMSVSSVEDHIDSSMYTTSQSLPNPTSRHSILSWARHLFLSLRTPFFRRRSQQQYQYHSPPQRPAAPPSPPQAVTIYYHPVIPPGYPHSSIAPHTPVVPGAWQNTRQYNSPPSAYAPAPTPALMPAQWDTHSRGHRLSRSQGPPYTAYNLQAYNHSQIAQNHRFVPPTQRYPVPPPGAYSTYATPHPNRMAHQTMPASYPPSILKPPYPGSSWTQAMLDPELVRPAPYTNLTPAIVPSHISPTPYAHPLHGPHARQPSYRTPPQGYRTPSQGHPVPPQGYPLPPPPRDIRPVDRSVSPDSQPPHPSWLGPNGEIPPRGGTPPRYRRNTPRRASTPPRQLTPSPPSRSSTPRATPTAHQHPPTTPRQHLAPAPHTAHTLRPTPTPAQSATPLSQLVLLQPPMLSVPPQSILSEISIPSAPGHRGIGKFEAEEPVADTEDGRALEPSRGRRLSRGRKRSKSRKAKAEEGGS